MRSAAACSGHPWGWWHHRRRFFVFSLSAGITGGRFFLFLFVCRAATAEPYLTFGAGRPCLLVSCLPRELRHIDNHYDGRGLHTAHLLIMTMTPAGCWSNSGSRLRSRGAARRPVGGLSRWPTFGSKEPYSPIGQSRIVPTHCATSKTSSVRALRRSAGLAAGATNAGLCLSGSIGMVERPHRVGNE